MIALAIAPLSPYFNALASRTASLPARTPPTHADWRGDYVNTALDFGMRLMRRTSPEAP